MYNDLKQIEYQDIKKSKNGETELLIEPGPDDEEEDDFFLKGPMAKKSVRFATDKMKNVQAQISGVTEVMRDNVGRLLERGDQLDELNARSDHLISTADNFRNTSTRLNRDMWWQHTKYKIVVGGAIFILLLLIFIPVIVKYNSV